MPVISPFHICASFFSLCWKKSGKRRKKRERSENSRRYYCAACMAPVILPFHLCFLLHWQMVVIRQYGNTVVKIVFTDFFFPFGIYDLMIIMRALWSWTEGHSARVVWIKRVNVCHMGMTYYPQTAWVFGKWCAACMCTLMYYNTPKCW